MKMTDIINQVQEIEKFKKILTENFFDKNDIEEFLKTNPKCSEDYIKAITEYVNLNYSDGTNIYLEISKYYVNKDNEKAIKYLEIYKMNGGCDPNSLMLLMKLYRNKGDINNALKITDIINFDSNRERIEEVFYVYTLFSFCDEKIIQRLEKMFSYIDNYKKDDKEDLLKNILNSVLEKIKFDNNETLMLSVAEKLKKVNTDTRKSIMQRVLKYSFNIYINKADMKFMNEILFLIKDENENIEDLFNSALALKVENLNLEEYEELKVKNLLQILRNHRNILTDWNKFYIVEIVLLYYRSDSSKIVNLLSDFIDRDNVFFDDSIKQRILKYFLNIYIETADTKFIDQVLLIINDNSKNIDDLFNSTLALKIENLNFEQIKEIEIKNLLQILKKHRNILTDWNKLQIIETVLSYYKNDIPKTVKVLCDFIDNDNVFFDEILSRGLTSLLRNKVLSLTEKDKIIEILKKYYKKSKNVKYKNIFLNEIEILENKIILKSKPRAVMASLTTKCNLKCIMCNVIDHKTDKVNEMDSKFYKFVVANMPYLEEVVWQGGEVFLYEKFKYLSELAHKYSVKQKIITNALLLNEDLIKKLNKYQVNLQVSVDAVDKKTYEEIRVGAKFENLLDKIELLKKYKEKKHAPAYSIETVVISKNFKQLEDLVKFAIFHKFEIISFLKYIVYKKDDLQLTLEQTTEVIDTIVSLRNKYKNISIKTNIELDYSCQVENSNDENENENKISGNNIKNNIEKNKKDYGKYELAEDIDVEETKYKDLFCVSPWTRIYLDFNTYIRITCLSNQMDISKYKYNEIWNCPEMAEYRRKIVDNDFSNCNALCRGCGEYTERAKIGLF